MFIKYGTKCSKFKKTIDNSIVYRINKTKVLLAAQTIDSYRCHAEYRDNITHYLIMRHEKLEDVNKTMIWS